MSLPEKIVTLHHVLKAAGIEHAFGGALALAWCTQQARGTIDIDVNIFVSSEQAETVLRALPDAVSWSASNLEELLREGQVRVWWDKTPLDLFLNTLKLHDQMSRRIRWEMFTGESIPFLSCQDIAILKVFFNRTKDWADLEAMVEAGTIRIPEVTARIIEYLGADDERVAKLAGLSSIR
ncbi:MAG: hypothetical protein O3B72_01590 [Proteobacteria bacterium]|nr:hypothetical protein [Pseudomonadota bacterium]